MARLFSPKNSATNGKQDSPGASEGKSIFIVRPFAEFLSMLKKPRTGGIRKYRKKLKTTVIKGTIARVESSGIFIKAIKMVEGKATVSTISLMPPTMSLFLYFAFKKIPSKISKISVRDFCNASFITESLKSVVEKSSCNKSHSSNIYFIR